MKTFIKYQKTRTPIKPWVIFAVIYALCTTIALLFLLLSGPTDQSLGTLENSSKINEQSTQKDMAFSRLETTEPIRETELSLEAFEKSPSISNESEHAVSLTYYIPTTNPPFLISQHFNLVAKVQLKDKLELLFQKIVNQTRKSNDQGDQLIRALYEMESMIVLDLNQSSIEKYLNSEPMKLLQTFNSIAFTTISNSNHDRVKLLIGGKDIALNQSGLAIDFSKAIRLNSYLIQSKEN